MSDVRLQDGATTGSAWQPSPWCRRRSPGKATAGLAFVVFALVGLARGSTATASNLCGDDVAGLDVPCHCGDVVVSDVVLDGDPVTTAICGDNGLIVRAPEATRPVTVDLRGHTLRGGAGGTGILVLHGGPGGARVISTGARASVEGFEDGVYAHGAGSLALLENIEVVNSRRDGIRIDALGYEIRNSESHHAGRHGFWLAGRGFRLSRTRAVGAGRAGYFVMGQDATLGLPGAGPVAEAAGESGFNVMGMNVTLVDCVARGSAKDGVMLMGSAIAVHGCTAANNRADGIGGMGSALRLSNNRATENGRHGIMVDGMVEDEGGNRGSGNRGEGAQNGAVQCKIHKHPCVT